MEDLEAASGMDDFEQLSSENNGINTTKSSNCQSIDNNNHGTVSTEKSSALNLKGAVQLPIQKKGENILRDFIVWYLELLNKFPISTKMLTSAFVQFCGSIVAQKFVLKVKKIDWHSVFKFTCTGALCSPLSHFWYQTHDSIMKTLDPILQIIQKQYGIPLGQMVSLGLDQLVFAPFLNCVFMAYLAIFDGEPKNISHNIKRDLWPTLKKSWMVWPFASYVNLNYVPSQLRVLFANMVGFFWSIYLSYSLRGGRK
jgi:peroxisomal membrane protein 2